MKNLIIITLVIISLIGFQAKSQDINGYLKNKAKGAVSKEANKEADKSIDKGIGKLKDKFNNNSNDTANQKSTDNQPVETPSNNENQNQNQEIQSNPYLKMIGGGTAKYDNSYSFTGNMSMKMQSWDEKGKSQGPIDYKTYMNETTGNYAMELSQSTDASAKKTYMIYDVKNLSMLILSDDGSKAAMVMSFQPIIDSLASNTEDSKNEQINFTKTGKTKQIAGYTCEEWTSQSGNLQQDIWVTKDINYNYRGIYGSMPEFKTAMTSGNYPNGFLMEMTTINTQTTEKMNLVVTEVNPKQTSEKNLDGYNVVNMGNMQMPTGK